MFYGIMAVNGDGMWFRDEYCQYPTEYYIEVCVGEDAFYSYMPDIVLNPRVILPIRKYRFPQQSPPNHLC